MQRRFTIVAFLLLNTFLASSAIAVPVNEALVQTDSIPTIDKLPVHYMHAAGEKADKLNRQLTRNTTKALRRLQKQEEKINRKLNKVDSLASDNLLTHSIDSLSCLRAVIQGKAGKIEGWTDRLPGKNYIPYLDTLKNALGFLNQYGSKLNQLKNGQEQLQTAMGSVQALESRMQQLQGIQQYMDERKALLAQVLSKYGDAFQKDMSRITKNLAFYKGRVQNYKALWQEPDKLEAKTLEMLHQVPAFNRFMQKHSALAALFNVSRSTASGSLEEELQGLQTRQHVQQALQGRLQAGGTDGRQRISQQMTRARQHLRQLKDKLSSGGSTADMPDFQPRDLKSHTLFQRLEFGGNVGVSKPPRFSSVPDITFPTTSDIAGQVAYKFSDKGSVGVGVAFKLGWGTSIRKIHFTMGGYELRSFIDWQIRQSSFYLNGGMEMHFNQTAPDVPELEALNDWVPSALLGLKKKYKINDKLKGTMMLLFDFLYQQHLPRTQPVVFRVGYSF